MLYAHDHIHSTSTTELLQGAMNGCPTNSKFRIFLFHFSSQYTDFVPPQHFLAGHEALNSKVPNAKVPWRDYFSIDFPILFSAKIFFFISDRESGPVFNRPSHQALRWFGVSMTVCLILNFSNPSIVCLILNKAEHNSVMVVEHKIVCLI